jgi:hypothetical protein
LQKRVKDFMGGGATSEGDLRKRGERYGVSLRKDKRGQRIKERRREIREERVMEKMGVVSVSVSEAVPEKGKVRVREFVEGLGKEELEEGAKIEASEYAKKVGRAVVERIEVQDEDFQLVAELAVNPNDLLRYIGV